VSNKPGRFELAHKGTLFLDEIGDLPREMQVKLLRAIQDHEFERVGGIQTIKVDVRLVAATNRNLQQDVKEGHFREDLFYRLNVMPIHVPPLRERKEDIPALVRYFVDKFNRKLDRQITGADAEVMELLKDHDWPGSIRELENLIERLVLMAKGGEIVMGDVPAELIEAVEEKAQTAAPDEKRSIKELIREKTGDIEKQMIVRVLEECEGNISKAARQLGLSRRGLHLKLAKYNLR
jgi:transcriptional regulator with PAS, ATPase and Fis domain